MEPRMKKNCNQKSGSDIPSPVLLRRRLSAPETVMRKYKLERARSQESDSDPNNDQKFEDLSNSRSGSDMNLQKKKDTAVMMRKSTLLRRLMNNPKTFGSSSFQEWQHYCGKLSTPSLNSLQGSPEHMSKSYSRRSLIGYEYKTSPKHGIGSKKVSPVHQLHETHKKSPVHLASMSPKRRIDHSYQIHRPKENTSFRSSVNDNLSKTTGQTDSAYSNDRSNYTLSSCSSNRSHSTAKEAAIYKNNTGTLDQVNVDENRNFSVDTSLNFVTQETSTQTASATNLNVISNVKLSQKTLDMIVSEVMKDVQKSCTNGNDIQETTSSIHVRKISGITAKPAGTNDFLRCLNDATRYTGGVNSSRISLLSSKSSMGDRSDILEDHSDVVSLADSLEETSSSRLSYKRPDDKPVRGDLPPIPVKNRRKLISMKPPDAFFIPIKKDIEETKSVSDYLPEKLKEKILRRQKNREDKFNQPKDNMDFLNEKEKSKPQYALRNKGRFRKPLLPSIEKFRKKHKEPKVEEPEEKSNTKKTKTKTKENPSTYRKSKSISSHHSGRHFNLFTTENDYSYDGAPKRIYHKAEFRNSNRRIEILEIMECVDLGEKTNRITTKTKSRIPILREPKNINPFLMKKATYFSEIFKTDPNIDQLITDILIQSMSNNPVQTTKHEKKEFKKPELPEEVTRQMKPTNDSGVQVSEEEWNKNSETEQVPKIESRSCYPNFNEGRTVKDTKNTQTITDEWIGYHPPQKKEELSDHTSTEGRKTMNEMKNRKRDEEEYDLSAEEWRRYRNMQAEYELERLESNGKKDFYKRVLPPPLPRRYSQSSTRHKYGNTTNDNPTPGEWSIILSGMNNATLASDLEMKIRFPSSHRTNSFPFNNNEVLRDGRANNGIYNEMSGFQNTNHHHFNNLEHENSFRNGSDGRYRKLPGINLRDPENRRVSDPVAAFRAMEISDIRPRQTKTSLKRYSMTRPKLHPLFEANVDCSNIESQYTGMLRRVPDLLTINGYSVSPDNHKYNIPGMARQIRRHDCISNGI